MIEAEHGISCYLLVTQIDTAHFDISRGKTAHWSVETVEMYPPLSSDIPTGLEVVWTPCTNFASTTGCAA